MKTKRIIEIQLRYRLMMQQFYKISCIQKPNRKHKTKRLIFYKDFFSIYAFIFKLFGVKVRKAFVLSGSSKTYFLQLKLSTLKDQKNVRGTAQPDEIRPNLSRSGKSLIIDISAFLQRNVYDALTKILCSATWENPKVERLEDVSLLAHKNY